MKSLLFIFIVALVTTWSRAQEEAFGGVNTAKSFKDIKNHNPINTLKYSADPGVMVYDGRVYVYGTNDGYVGELGGNPETNGYGQINTLNVMSSSDLVNWIDHGTIPVAGANGAAKWATNSWAPCACHKEIDGKEMFFVYFANNGSGIGVIRSESPTGPFEDPIGGPLVVHGRTPNTDGIVWLFDPAVLVDDDGTGYLYFGGGVPEGQAANPKTVRAVKLGKDMISLDGEPVMIDAPWVFEDSGIHKADKTYYYSYCTNWDGGPYGNARIALMSSDSPLGPFTYVDTCFNNPGDFFGTVGNNHHTIIGFKDKWYIFYHTEWLNKQEFGDQKGYRTSHVNELPYSGGKFGNAEGTLEGVPQLEPVNPYEANFASMMAWEAGVSVNGLGHTTVSYNKGDWTGVSEVDFGDGATSIKISAASGKGATIRITSESENGDVIGYVTVPATGGDDKFEEVTADVKVSGKKNIFFVASDDVTIDTWQFVGSGGSQAAPAEEPAPGSAPGSAPEPVAEPAPGSAPEPVSDPVPGSGPAPVSAPEPVSAPVPDSGPAPVSEPVPAPAPASENDFVLPSTDQFTGGVYFIVNPDSGKYLQLNSKSKLGVGEGNKSDKQKWNISASSEGYVKITSATGNHSLAVSKGKVKIVDSSEEDASQQFMIVVSPIAGAYSIVSKDSKGQDALEIKKDSISQSSNEGKSNQLWSFEKAARKPRKVVGCWSEPLGYPCCSDCLYSWYSDEDGEWGVENDEWCGIYMNCLI